MKVMYDRLSVSSEMGSMKVSISSKDTPSKVYLVDDGNTLAAESLHLMSNVISWKYEQCLEVILDLSKVK